MTSELNITKSKPLQGTAPLQGDSLLNCQGLLLASLAEGESTLDNVPESQWFTDLLGMYSALGGNAARQDSQLVIQGPKTSFETVQTPLQPQHETVLMGLGGLFAGLKCPSQIEINPQYIPRGTKEAFLELFDCQPDTQAGENTGTFRVMGINQGSDFKTGDEYLIKSGKLYYHACTKTSFAGEFKHSGPDHLEKLLSLCKVDVMSQKPGQKELSELEKRMARNQKQAPSAQYLGLPDSFVLKPLSARFPNDISLASAYALAATLIPGSEITLENVLLNPTRTGFFTALRRMGADIEILHKREMSGETSGTVKVKYAELKGRTFHAEMQKTMRDEIPLLIIAGAFGEGETIIRGIDFLRRYDRDLLKHMIQTLKQINVKIGELEDGLVIKGGAEYDGHSFSSRNHAMVGLAFLVMGMKCHGKSTLEGTDCVHYQFPNGIDNLTRLAAS